MGVRAYNRCLTIAVVTILCLMMMHVSLLIWFERFGDRPEFDVRDLNDIRSHHHPRKNRNHNGRQERIPVDTQIAGMNCTTTSLGGLSCDFAEIPPVRNTTNELLPSVNIYNDAVNYYSCAIYISCHLYLQLINLLLL